MNQKDLKILWKLFLYKKIQNSKSDKRKDELKESTTNQNSNKFLSNTKIEGRGELLRTPKI